MGDMLSLHTVCVLTSAPPEPHTVLSTTCPALLQQLHYVKLVVIVFEVGLVEHGVPMHSSLTVHTGLVYRRLLGHY